MNLWTRQSRKSTHTHTIWTHLYRSDVPFSTLKWMTHFQPAFWVRKPAFCQSFGGHHRNRHFLSPQTRQNWTSGRQAWHTRPSVHSPNTTPPPHLRFAPFPLNIRKTIDNKIGSQPRDPFWKRSEARPHNDTRHIPSFIQFSFFCFDKQHTNMERKNK